MKMKCDCGKTTKALRYKDGKRICDICTPQVLSGTFLRRIELEAKTYAKDILQPTNKDGSINKNYEEVYGTYNPSTKKRKEDYKDEEVD